MALFHIERQRRWIMDRRVAWAVAVTALVAFPVSGGDSVLAAPGLDQGPRAFVESIITRTRAGGANDDRTFLRLFTPELRALILTDRKAAGDQDAPYLDGDPFCDCQDSEGLVMRIVSVSQRDGMADILIRNHFDGSGDADRYVTLRLRMTRAGWRVDDVATREQPSLRAGLRDSLHQGRE
jgi:hypothetical protein